jgi:hypothetical protein
METVSTDQERLGDEKQLRRPYCAPELTRLGEVQILTECGGELGNDGMHGGFCAS